MGVTNLDIDVLRSFATGVELGSFARAAERLGRSTSAISAQLKKLEEQVGQPVLRKSGRGLALTATGEIVLSYARRLLELNDAAVLAVRGAQLVGSVRVGFQEDFGEALLSEVLGRFARTHPAVTVDARIARNEELAKLLALARLDLVLSWQAGTPGPYPQPLGRLPMRWIGDPLLVATHRQSAEPLPLVVFESPCLMRSCAIDALDRAGIAWRVAFTSSSLNGIWAAVQAGLGVTVRTEAGKPAALSCIETLPDLPDIGLCLGFSRADPDPVVVQLASIIRERLAGLNWAAKPSL